MDHCIYLILTASALSHWTDKLSHMLDGLNFVGFRGLILNMSSF
jgi:hypothetical protein